MDWTAVETISDFTASPGSGLSAVFAAEANKVSLLRFHVVLHKTIKSGLRVRRPPLPRCRDWCAHLSYNCIVYQYSHRRAWILHTGDRSAILQWINFPIPGDSWRVPRSNVSGSKRSPLIHR